MDGVFLEYRELIMSKKKILKDIFLQANTVCVDGRVELRGYESTAKGMVRSWFEREV